MGEVIDNIHLKKYRRQLRKRMTKSEVIFWKRVRAKLISYKFRRQVSIGKYIVDFYCPSAKLVIELDGSTHREEVIYKKDVEKEAFLKSKGYSIKRYNDDTVINNTEAVISDIYETCKQLSSS